MDNRFCTHASFQQIYYFNRVSISIPMEEYNLTKQLFYVYISAWH